MNPSRFSWPEVWSLRNGTRLSIGLFLGTIVIKFVLGTWAYLDDVSDDRGFGEVMLMIGLAPPGAHWRSEKLGETDAAAPLLDCVAIQT